MFNTPWAEYVIKCVRNKTFANQFEQDIRNIKQRQSSFNTSLLDKHTNWVTNDSYKNQRSNYWNWFSNQLASIFQIAFLIHQYPYNFWVAFVKRFKRMAMQIFGNFRYFVKATLCLLGYGFSYFFRSILSM